ncbi:MAG: N-acetylmuramoyl-L-alanine amidase [Desulfotomaculaceae bacterium]|nr:N-acetylmuramoyl-L-alanine amidase [Desulfotomaculaceae bacterium]
MAELAFISNVSEEKLMNTDNFRNKSAEAIVNGIGYYFSEKKTA